MMNSQNNLAHALKLKFGLPPDAPTQVQLTQILREIEQINNSDRTDTKWREIVHKYVPCAGQYGYFGLDTSDLNALYMMLLKELGR